MNVKVEVSVDAADQCGRASSQEQEHQIFPFVRQIILQNSVYSAAIYRSTRLNIKSEQGDIPFQIWREIPVDGPEDEP